ncbi:sigma-54 interaction domain-containing protein [Fictibacillus aquaticus]|uniref:Sigma-54-dependent Fis family transcriptional regulator n=1 Tax=Fictibacillus aquaticus TaxID=2021314 RepID=A0A235F9P9_9BACL|nr:sigma 54-interacting transcriptional regulator [Fictibacillus aquaticus]OYD57982.1 sigma-54-dependent Fis family transcriptional regulator [Fictibacillus aquaticus]
MFAAHENVKNSILEAIIDSAYEWIVVVDKEGIIQYMNRTYAEFLGENIHSVTGRHVCDVIENTRMHKVVESGVPEIADLQYIRGNYMIANRIPVKVDDEVIGAVGTVIFRDTGQWKKMNSHIKSLLHELEFYKKDWHEKNGAKYSLQDLEGRSEKMVHLKGQVKKAASSDLPVLISGESGTGKELIAHSIHQLSERSGKPFIKVNCGAIPETLFESELFGYEEGAFTGAKKGGKAGKFGLADGGTIFLDEIGDLPSHMQIKLLRVLQEKEIETIGSTVSRKVDVRIIAATNRPLQQMIVQRQFREDLYYRINVIPLNVPPLRDRKEDIPGLVAKLLDKITSRSGKRIIGVENDVMNWFLSHQWPGNIRELENVLEAASHFSPGEIILADFVPGISHERVTAVSGEKSLKEILQETEEKVLRDTLRDCSFDKKKAASLLGIGKTVLYEKIKKYNIQEV